MCACGSMEVKEQKVLVLLGGMGWVASVVGWLVMVTDLGVCPFAVCVASPYVHYAGAINGGTYLRYEVVVWQPEPHPGDLAVIVGLGVGGRSRGW